MPNLPAMRTHNGTMLRLWDPPDISLSEIVDTVLTRILDHMGFHDVIDSILWVIVGVSYFPLMHRYVITAYAFQI